MIKIFEITLIFALLSIVSGCSQILETVDLKLDLEDKSTQDRFHVVEKVLTIREAQKLNTSFYNRVVLQPGIGNAARTISENIIIQSQFPDEIQPNVYKIGLGDTLTFSRLIENNYSNIETSRKWPKNLESFSYKLGVGDKLALTLLKEKDSVSRVLPGGQNNDQNLLLESKSDTVLQTMGRIGSDGSVLLLEVGRLEAKGKTLNELQSEVRNILIRNGVSPRFQLEIDDFRSQKAYLTINGRSELIVLGDEKASLRDLLTKYNVGFGPGIVTIVKLQRQDHEYLMPLRSIFNEAEGDIYIIDRDHIFVQDSRSEVISNLSTVGHDGRVVLPGVGSLKAAGLSINEIKSKITTLIDKVPDSENAFQIKVTEFASQKALVNISGKAVNVVTITDIPLGLDEVLTENGLKHNKGSITRISLRRQGRQYFFTLDQLLNLKTKRIYLQPNDRVTTENLEYRDNKVFILGGIDPQIFKIDPAKRETLADVLFTDGGVLSSPGAKRSEVYLLRGTSPVVAYHLDAQSPTRLIVANAMELRPNDILYVAEQPIISFNRALTTIIPLRELLGDISEGNYL